MALCTVALGNVYETKSSKYVLLLYASFFYANIHFFLLSFFFFYRWHLTAPPRNYHSCHGIPAQNGDFKEPHFAVYNQNQVCFITLIIL